MKQAEALSKSKSLFIEMVIDEWSERNNLASLAGEQSFRQVLIVSPNFPPVNTPDHQRVRMSLPYYKGFGWTPHILTLDPQSRNDLVAGRYDPDLVKTLPEDLQITWAKPIGGRIVGNGVASLIMQCLAGFHSAGAAIMKIKKIDLVFFSTTLFPLTILGPLWRRKYKIPYVMDFQDPWLSDYYANHRTSPPGGRLKYGLSQRMAEFLEPRVMRQVSQIISVSPAYKEILLRRYEWLGEQQFTILPFGAPEKDFEQMQSLGIKQKIFDPSDGYQHWVYVGVVPGSMLWVLKAFLAGIRQNRERAPGKWGKVKFHFVGTNYVPGKRAQEIVRPIAEQLGVADMIVEHASRVNYLEALKILQDSHGILVIGSDDPGYTASKIYPCILARKPLLAICHEKSSIVELLNRCHCGEVLTFNQNTSLLELGQRIAAQFQDFLSHSEKYTPSTDWTEFAQYSAREMTRHQCLVFNKAVNFIPQEKYVDQTSSN